MLVAPMLGGINRIGASVARGVVCPCALCQTRGEVLRTRRLTPRSATRLLSLGALAVLMTGTSFAGPPRPAAGPVIAPPSPEEAHRLDAASRDLEIRIERTGRLYGRVEVDAYMNGIADRLLAAAPESPSQSVRVRAVKDSFANAFVLPNGDVFVTTELLCDLDSEAEVAAILSHEIVHFTRQHALQEMRDQKHKTALSHGFGNTLGLLVTIVAARYGASVTQIGMIPQNALDVWTVASVAGYSRDLEREADRDGLRHMAAAGYDVSAAVRAFEKLAAAAPDAGNSTPVKYASHPKLAERIQSAQALVNGELLGATAADRYVGHDEYRAHVAGIELDQVLVLVESGNIERASRLIQAEVANNDSARAAYLEGNVANLTVPRTPQTEAHALAAYTRSTMLPGTPPASFRQIGILQRERGDPAAAMVAFQTYLERAPGAADAPLIKLYLTDLRAPQVVAPLTKGDP
jgi:beta-barrel assembly-enhancing protease